MAGEVLGRWEFGNTWADQFTFPDSSRGHHYRWVLVLRLNGIWDLWATPSHSSVTKSNKTRNLTRLLDFSFRFMFIDWGLTFRDFFVCVWAARRVGGCWRCIRCRKSNLTACWDIRSWNWSNSWQRLLSVRLLWFSCNLQDRTNYFKQNWYQKGRSRQKKTRETAHHQVLDVIGTHPPACGHGSERRVQTVHVEQKGAIITLDQRSQAAAPKTKQVQERPNAALLWRSKRIQNILLHSKLMWRSGFSVAHQNQECRKIQYFLKIHFYSVRGQANLSCRQGQPWLSNGF